MGQTEGRTDGQTDGHQIDVLRLPFDAFSVPIRPILGFWKASGGARFPEMRDSLPWTPMKRRAKFDAASFILGGKIRNRTNKQTNKHTNSNRYTNCLSTRWENIVKRKPTYGHDNIRVTENSVVVAT